MSRRRRRGSKTQSKSINQPQRLNETSKENFNSISRDFISKDIKRVAIVTGVCIAILGLTVWFAQTQPAINNLAIKLYKFLNL